jgi:hypothetical protein
LAVVALAQLMVVLDATIVNIALPSAQHALHFSDIERQWVVTGYALAFGSLLLLGGRPYSSPLARYPDTTRVTCPNRSAMRSPGAAHGDVSAACS